MTSEKEIDSSGTPEEESRKEPETETERRPQEQKKYIKKWTEIQAKLGTLDIDSENQKSTMNGIENVISYYASIIKEEEPDKNNNFHFSGNVALLTNHQDIGFLLNSLVVKSNERGFTAFTADARDIISATEPVELYRDVIEPVTLHPPSIVVITNAELILANKPDEMIGKHARKFARELRRFIVDKNFKFDKMILVLHVDEIENVDPRMVNSLDISFDIDKPTQKERESYLHHLFPANGETSFSIVSKEMDGWTWNDIKAFAKRVVLHVHKTGSSEITLKSFMDLLLGDDGTERYVPPSMIFSQRSKGAPAEGATNVWISRPPGSNDEIQNKKNVLLTDSVQDLCNPFKEQLFQQAAANDYDILTKILERLERQVILPSDKPFLMKYPFLLNEEVSIVKKKLDGAKQRVEVLKQNLKR
nr:hypothetical protein [Candidatus Sigynarchaeota archaeon]